MTPKTSTTIRGVSILSRDKKQGQDVFELALSALGIEVRRPERPAQHLSWDRVSEWKVEERKGYVLLTLRGQGATTPLVVPGWTPDDLETLMREVTTGAIAPERAAPEPAATDRSDRAGRAAAAVVASPTPVRDDPGPASAASPPTEAPAPAAGPTRAARRRREANGEWRQRLSWRVVVTVVLLAVLTTAVLLVLLQSAGIIDWSFLGPPA